MSENKRHLPSGNIITLDYGSGGTKTSRLIEDLLLPAFDNPTLNELGDGAILPGSGNHELVFSTDSFVVSPWKFPGGDIGKLSVCGTVNDVCMAGGIPRYLSLSLILEEGFSFSSLEEIVDSIAKEAKKANVLITTGDTKVVEAGSGDGIYINTAGIGYRHSVQLSRSEIKPGDSVLISGSIGCHGATVMMARAGLLTEGDALRSDCQCLTELSAAALEAGGIRVMRDPTRGGVATTLNEFAEQMPFSIELSESRLPLDPCVTAACDLLGLDPLYCACEGRMLLIAAPGSTDRILDALHALPGGEQAAKIGTVTEKMPGRVILNTKIGGSRILAKLSGQQLPRIC